MTQQQLERALKRAARREWCDDHLTDSEREALVNEYRRQNPSRVLPDDLTDTFIELIDEFPPTYRRY